MKQEDWVKGLRAERALEKDMGAHTSWWPTLIPELSSGSIRLRCKRAVISDLVHSGVRMKSEPAEEREDWVIPAVAWDTVDRDSLGSGLSSLEGFFEYVRLDDNVDLRFLDRTDSVLVSASGLEFERGGLVESFELSAEAQAVLDGQPVADAPKLAKASRPRRGPDPDMEKYAQFAAGLAYIANTVGLDTFKSRSETYKKVSDFLATGGIEAMDEKNFRRMIHLARLWVDEGDKPPVV